MTAQTIDWLLEKSDPGVRAFALRDLLETPADDPEVLAARRATVRHSPVKEILEAQEPGGFWVKSGPGCGPKYQGTVWQVTFLAQLGGDGLNALHITLRLTHGFDRRCLVRQVSKGKLVDDPLDVLFLVLGV